jgi:hypothetical protein
MGSSVVFTANLLGPLDGHKGIMADHVNAYISFGTSDAAT